METRKKVLPYDCIIDISQYQKVKGDRRVGGFASVEQVQSPDNETIYALKKAFFKKVTPHYLFLNYFLREVTLLSIFDHPSIVRSIGFNLFEINKKKESPQRKNKVIFNPCILMKFHKRTLDQLIQNMKNKKVEISSVSLYVIIVQICRGINYLHQLNIVHRDIKPSNILIDDFLHPKICDFNGSKYLVDLNSSLRFGTLDYQAPEIFDGSISLKADIYSLAITLYQLFELKNSNWTYGKLCKEFLRNESNRPSFSAKTPKVWQDLIKKMWSYQPEMRPTMNEVCQRIERKEFRPANISNEEEQYIQKQIEELVKYDIPQDYLRDSIQNITNNGIDDEFFSSQKKAVDYLLNYASKSMSISALIGSGLYYMNTLGDYCLAYETFKKIKAESIEAQVLLKHIKQMANINPLIMGMKYESSRKFDEAIKFYIKAMTCKNNANQNKCAMGRLGRILLSCQEKKGIVLLEKASSGGDKFSSFHLGIYFYNKGNYNKSVDYFQKAGDYPDAYYYLGLSYKEIHNNINATNAFKRAEQFYCTAKFIRDEIEKINKEKPQIDITILPLSNKYLQ
ncbi:hypothetical protein TRFO_18424 [Tritrichomonas foetus]|uniref:Protein kinase domain-containing protein n=1 Tax=Tritrichomonas foetus TaxID=1144522 RepID=A0A1J4KKX3_9EUKA|nr:hypothetical protein TRFO_18424 [Tritrichomonas foetus]|eukprot:OHT11943.1 hypothetical protein TRFO_18424 [Tritrichomonas foetus]